MLIVTGHFVVEINGMAQTISIDFLGNDHHGVFFSYEVVLYAFCNLKDQLVLRGPKKRLRVKDVSTFAPHVWKYGNFSNMQSYTYFVAQETSIIRNLCIF